MSAWRVQSDIIKLALLRVQMVYRRLFVTTRHELKAGQVTGITLLSTFALVVVSDRCHGAGNAQLT
jgi:hypothetical protein